MASSVNFKEISVHTTPEDSPGFLLWHVSTLWRRAIEDVLKPLNLTHPQFVILATVGWLTKEGDRVTQADIGRQAGLDPNTTSQILRGLLAKKFIKRARSTDERSKHPILTAEGSALLQKALPAVEQADAKFFAPVISKKTKIIAILQKLGQMSPSCNV